MSATRPQLHGTPKSHFTRKLRILMLELGVEFDFVRVSTLMTHDAAAYAHNPLLRVPSLHHEGVTLFESDHIARYLIDRFDPADRLGVTSGKVEHLNHLAVSNGIMDSEAVLVLAERGGMTDLDSVVYFRKLKAGIDEALGWLEARTVPDAPSFDYRDIALVSMWQHVEHNHVRPDLERYAKIRARVAQLMQRPSVSSTTPEASVAASG